MTDEQIEAAIEMIQGMLAAREAGADAKVIEGTAEPRVSEPGPRRKAKRLADLTLTEPGDNGDNASPKGFERTGPPQDMGLATVNPSKSP
jgi:hypothetical protein